jgi:hypothetical protein
MNLTYENVSGILESLGFKREIGERVFTKVDGKIFKKRTNVTIIMGYPVGHAIFVGYRADYYKDSFDRIIEGLHD